MAFGGKREMRRRSRPDLESLEGRVVLTTFHAANMAEFRADLAAVSNAKGPNTIILAPGVYKPLNETLIRDAGDLTIQGTTDRNGSTTIEGDSADRIFEIIGGTVTFRNLSISGGGNVAQGGGIRAQDADLTVINSTVAGNKAQVGGGIYAQGGTLNVANSSVSENAASLSNANLGGGIAAVDAHVTVADSTINGNVALGPDPGPQSTATDIGGGIYAQGGTLAIATTDLIGNTAFAVTSGTVATSAGGAVASYNTVVTVARSTIANNSLNAIGSQPSSYQGSAFSTVGGSLTIGNSVLSRNTPDGLNEFYHPGATVVLKSSTIDKKKFSGTNTLGPQGFRPIG